MSAQLQPIIEINDLSFAYPGRTQQPVLQIPQWQVMAGQQLFLHGPSGCGKSTLLNLLTGILCPGSGRIRLLNENFSGLSGRQRDRFLARHIGVVFQQFNLIPYLSVAENIQLAVHFSSIQRSFGDSKIATLIEQLQLPKSLLAQRADSLSVGQQQRVAIARALINEPEILVVDEPTSALDADACEAFMALLLAVSRSNNSTLLFVSHDFRLAQHFDETVSLASLNTVANNAV